MRCASLHGVSESYLDVNEIRVNYAMNRGHCKICTKELLGGELIDVKCDMSGLQKKKIGPKNPYFFQSVEAIYRRYHVLS